VTAVGADVDCRLDGEHQVRRCIPISLLLLLLLLNKIYCYNIIRSTILLRASTYHTVDGNGSQSERRERRRRQRRRPQMIGPALPSTVWPKVRGRPATFRRARALFVWSYHIITPGETGYHRQ